MKHDRPFTSRDKVEKANFPCDQHPSKDINGTLGSEFNGKKIIICVTASVACYKTIDLIRKFMRHGAEVFVVISKAVETFIKEDYFLWASGNPVTSELSGELEHVKLANYNSSDLVIVYPCTGNTIGKFASGIDDTPVTSVLSIALGSRIPIIISPAMHEAMYYNPIIKDNIHKLELLGITFTKPVLQEDKAKVSSVEDVFRHATERLLNTGVCVNQNEGLVAKKNSSGLFFCSNLLESISSIEEYTMRSFFQNKKILISLGSTVEFIDPIRVISNTSSGKMGLSIVQVATRFGSKVTILKGYTQIDEKIYQHNKQFSQKLIGIRTTDEMSEALTRELEESKYDLVILSAAVSDFKPQSVSDTKISTDTKSLDLKLLPTLKIIDKVKQIQHTTFLVAFKAEYSISKQHLIEKSFNKLIQCNADLIVANDVGSGQNVIGADTNKVVIVDKNRNYYDFPEQKKNIVAENIFKLVYLYLKDCEDK